jgi:hypothetical protein
MEPPRTRAHRERRENVMGSSGGGREMGGDGSWAAAGGGGARIWAAATKPGVGRQRWSRESGSGGGGRCLGTLPPSFVDWLLEE